MASKANTMKLDPVSQASSSMRIKGSVAEAINTIKMEGGYTIEMVVGGGRATISNCFSAPTPTSGHSTFSNLSHVKNFNKWFEGLDGGEGGNGYGVKQERISIECQ